MRRSAYILAALLLATATVALAEWKFNPHTGKLDYYEPAGAPADNALTPAKVKASTVPDNTMALFWDSAGLFRWATPAGGAITDNSIGAVKLRTTSGLPSATVFFRGDNAWAVPSTVPSDNSVGGVKLFSSSGLPSAATYYRGDNSWQTPSFTPADNSLAVSKLLASVTEGYIPKVSSGVVVWAPDAQSAGSNPGFDNVLTGTNTSATMTVGTGGTLTYSGSGIVNASRLYNNTAVDNTEFGYLDGVTSAIQTQIGGKQATITDNSVALSRLYTTGGTASGTTFLRGDNTWQVVTTTPADNSIGGVKLYSTSGLPSASTLYRGDNTWLTYGGAAVLNVGTSAGTVASGDDGRFVTNGNSHDHNGGDGAQVAYSTLSGLPTLGGAAALNVGTSAGTVAAGDDGRFVDARTPTAHALDSAYHSATSDNTSLNATTSAHGLVVKATAPASGLYNYVGITNGETAYTNKALFDATVPSTEAVPNVAATGSATVAARRDHSHAITLPALDSLAAPSDNTTLNATTSAHGLAPKGTAGTTQFWRQDWTLATPSAGAVSDNSIGGVKLYTTSGLPTASTYYRGDNTWATPSAGAVADNSVTPAKLYSTAGSAGATTFYRGDGTWQTPTATATQVALDSGSAGDHVAKAKLTADTKYRTFLGIDNASRGILAFGAGSTTDNDVAIYRSAAGEVSFDNVAGGSSSFKATAFRTTGADNTHFLNVNNSADPASPAAGDIWYDNTNMRVRVRGTSTTSTLLDNNASMVVAEAPLTDSTFQGIAVTMQAGENLVAGDVVYFKGSDGKAWKADANVAGLSPAMGLSLSTIAANATGQILLHGIARLDSWTWTPGSVLYLSTTVGGLTATQPSATDDVIQILGIATHADRVYFFPQLTWISHS